MTVSQARQGGEFAHRQGNVPARRYLGQILVDAGRLTADDQALALQAQSQIEARFGDILLSRGLVDRTELYETIARQYDTEVADFSCAPPDMRLVDALTLRRCLSDGILPWVRRGGEVLVASARPEQFERLEPELEALFGPVRMVVTSETDLHRAILDRHPRALAQQAETRVAAAESCRDWTERGMPLRLAGILGALGLALALAPSAVFLALAAWATLVLIANTALKALAVIAQVRVTRAKPSEAPAPIMARLPSVSILVPLFKEREIASRLIRRLSRLDYPRELLDICLVVEADDAVTTAMLEDLRLPAHIRQIVVPKSAIKTKPRALNFALDFCRGSIVGIYDAEDAPAPDQIMRVVRRFHERGPEVACLQGVLDFYNSRSNWLARCFTIEYATWFRVILPGLARLGLVLPLGGTTLFFRRDVLEKLGGWDAHNVTEDADLGLRLARRGYRTEMIGTVTGEEANCRVWPWIKQRSRWLKGYAITWAVHMRHPRHLLAELGLRRFIGVQVLFLGTISAFALAPVLWSFWLIPLGLPHPLVGVVPEWLIWAFGALFVTSEAIGIAAGVYAVRGPAHRFLAPWVPTLHFYFPLAALASYKGLAELVVRPFYWDKTAHGMNHARDPAEEIRNLKPLRSRRRRT